MPTPAESALDIVNAAADRVITITERDVTTSAPLKITYRSANDLPGEEVEKAYTLAPENSSERYCYESSPVLTRRDI